MQFFTLIIGLSLATGLWTGVQAINTEARSSYDLAKSRLVPDTLLKLARRDGGTISLATYVTLQKAGWRTSPVLEGQVDLGGTSITVTGIEPISLSQSAMRLFQKEDSISPTELFESQGTMFVSPDVIDLVSGLRNWPRARLVNSLPPGTIVMDISEAERVLSVNGRISRLLLHPVQNNSRGDLSVLAPQLRIQKDAQGADIERLTASFHLNLTAFGLLAFAVGLFIVQGTINLAFEQRRAMCRTMRVMGVSVLSLTAALLLELILIALLAGAMGVVIGYFIAAALLPDVAATLRGLYGAQVSGQLTFRPQWWLIGLAIALFGTLLASTWSLVKLINMPILASVRPRAWQLASVVPAIIRLCFAALLGLLAMMLWVYGSGLVVAFLIVGALLLGAALLMPQIIQLCLALFQRCANTAIGQWFWADTRQQMPGLSLALMALLLALATNIGVGTMVGSFRLTFEGWLDQRLSFQLYLRARDSEQAGQLKSWLEERSDAVVPIWSVEDSLNGIPGQVFGFADHSTYRTNWPMIEVSKEGWDDVARGRAVLINEQFARRNEIELGQLVAIGPNPRLPVAGIYSDYGNPRPQAMINYRLLSRWYPDVEKLRLAVQIAPEEAADLMQKIRSKFNLPQTGLVNQSQIKAKSIEIFERTFAVTEALNILTLAIAGFAIFTSLLTQATMRLPQLAPLWALGLTRRYLGWLEFLRALLLAGLTMLLAVPLGLLLAWLLLAVVNVEAFGWRLPLWFFEEDWLRLAIYALIAAGVAAVIPASRIRSTAPADLVKVFASER
ncbi:MAG: FtsX-like permease family protein [Rhizobiaceae bacterium]